MQSILVRTLNFDLLMDYRRHCFPVCWVHFSLKVQLNESAPSQVQRKPACYLLLDLELALPLLQLCCVPVFTEYIGITRTTV